MKRVSKPINRPCPCGGVQEKWTKKNIHDVNWADFWICRQCKTEVEDTK